MKFTVYLPGKIKPKALGSAQDLYIKRLQPFGVEVLEYRDERIAVREPERAREAEADRILKQLNASDYVIACDERGAGISTSGLAAVLRDARAGSGRLSGRRRLVVVIGGALGLSEKVRQRADGLWSLSGLVMAGGIARLVLLEGLYRSFTLIEGHPYHNE